MSTKLENYLKEQRRSLDVEYPDDKAIWDKISSARRDGVKELARESKPNIFLRPSLRRIAASVIIVLALGYIALDLSIGISPGNKEYLSQINSEYGRIEQEYVQAVKYRQKEVNNTEIPDNHITRSIIEELQELDKQYKIIIDDLVELGDNEQVVNTIFNIYERKIELLERIIVETNKFENYEKNKENNI